MKTSSSRKKFLCLIISGSFISGLFTGVPQALAANFYDVAASSSYYTAINYLADSGIINGYPDGSFKPEQEINRAEFLKLLLESSNVTTDVNTATNFSDIDENAWYAKYVRKARQEGWIEGYSDNTFRPAQPINKAEGLKIVAMVQGWQTAKVDIAPFNDVPAFSWFAPYVAYAKDRNFLEEHGRFFVPDMHYTRAQVSEILFRIYVTAENDALKYDPLFATSLPQPSIVTSGVTPEPLIPPPPPLDFTPYSEKDFSSDFFTDVNLDSGFTNNFYLNEVYYFKGQVITGRYNNAFVFLAPQNSTDTSQFTNYIGEMQANSFIIPVIFRKPGNYRLGLILGSSGESKVAYISVLPSLPNAPLTKSQHTPSSPRINYKNTHTTFSWDNAGNQITRLTVFQGNKTGRFIFRQNIENFDVDYVDFSNFNEGKVYYRFEGAETNTGGPLEFDSGWNTGTTENFSAVTHTFSQIVPDLISLSTLPEYASKIEPINFSGNTSTDIYAEAIVTKPDGDTENVSLKSSKPFGDYLGSPKISTGNDYSFYYNPSASGTYIIEINGTNGEAVINTPVYIANGIPLIPDFFDLNKLEQKEVTFDLPTLRNKLLDLINIDRQKAGLNPVRLDSSLNSLAQLHSEDMVARDFFGHINPDGESPNDRRIEAGITTAVGENLAQAPTILYSHYGLMRSGIHRQNILDPAWTRVGLGIAQDKYDQLFVTEEFSHDPLTDADLARMTGNILDEINNARRDKGIPLIEMDQTLTSIATDWSAKMASQDFFGFTSPNGENLSAIVQEQVPQKAVQAVILESNSESKLYDEILLGNDVTENQWRKLGIGLKLDNKGSIKATLLYTTI
jgi:uncharacterized protein YkwD